MRDRKALAEAIQGNIRRSQEEPTNTKQLIQHFGTISTAKHVYKDKKFHQ